MDPSISTFPPERCADLHNQLLAKAIERNPAARTERTLATRFLRTFPEFVDIRSYCAIWHRGGLSSRFPSADQFLPLNVILQYALDSWTTGKFYVNPATAGIATRTWTRYDLRQSIAAWDRLLSSVEARMPKGTVTGSRNRLPPLSIETLAPFKINALRVIF